MKVLWFKQKDSRGKLPVIADRGSVGYDLRSVEPAHLVPGQPTRVKLGVAVEITRLLLSIIKAGSLPMQWNPHRARPSAFSTSFPASVVSALGWNERAAS